MRLWRLGTALAAALLISVSVAKQVSAAALGGLQSTGLRGTAVSVYTAVPDGNAQNTLGFLNGRNYYFIQAGGSSVAYQFGITEGKNFGVYFREFFHSKVNASTGSGVYQAITGTPPAGTTLQLQIASAGNGNWYGRSPGHCQSPNENVAISEFDRAGVWVKTENGSRTTVDDGSYKSFWYMIYDDIVKGNNQAVGPSSPLQNKSYLEITFNKWGNLENKGKVGLFVEEID